MGLNWLMKKPFLTFTFCILVCSLQGQTQYFGHRGARGIAPENSILSFQKALEYPISGVEWDVVVNKDKELVISHEPYFKPSICQADNISDAQLKTYNIYRMTQAEIEKFDCGTKYNPNFPEQLKTLSTKPTFKEVVQQINFQDKTILFEIKSEKKEYGISQPFPEEFARIILDEVNLSGLKENIYFMSFDPNILNAIYCQDSTFRFIYLTYKPFKSVNKFLSHCTFKPYALGMYFPTITKGKGYALSRKGVKLFAWTVNNKEQTMDLIQKGVDGIITDFPDRINENLTNPH
jgi:glycerophosphoryl diester phosphodiesterase